MFINEYGNRNDPTVILLAPMMISGSDLYGQMSPFFQGSYHIIAPDQGGHGKAGAYISADEEYLDFLKNNGWQVAFSKEMAARIALLYAECERGKVRGAEL